MITRRLSLFAVPLILLTAVALAPARPDAPKAADAPKAGTTGELLVASVHVAKVWDHKAFVPVREARGNLEFAWMVQSLIGLAPTELERLTVVVPDPDTGPILIATGRKPVDPKAVVKTLTRGAGTNGPKPTEPGMLVAPGAEFAYVLPVDARTVLLAPTPAGRLSLTRIAETFGPKAVEGLAGSHALAVRLDVAAAKKLLGDQLPAGLLAAKSATLTAD